MHFVSVHVLRVVMYLRCNVVHLVSIVCPVCMWSQIRARELPVLLHVHRDFQDSGQRLAGTPSNANPEQYVIPETKLKLEL